MKRVLLTIGAVPEMALQQINSGENGDHNGIT